MKRIIFLAPAFLAGACSGTKDGGIVNPPPPVPETVTVEISIQPAFSASVSSAFHAVATGRSSKLGPISDNTKYTWTLNGSPAATGSSVNLTLHSGLNDICVTVRGAETSASTCTQASYNPVITGHVVSASSIGEGLVAPLRITFSKGGVTATANIGLDGNFSIPTDLASADTACFVMDALSGERAYHPMIGCASKADMAKGLVLIAIPRSYQIEAGEYAGQIVPIDLNLAYTAGSDSSAFYGRGQYKDGTWGYVVESYLPSSLPMATQFLTTPRETSPQGIANFWKWQAALESKLGFKIFRPALPSESLTSSTGLLVSTDPSITTGWDASTSVNGDGTKYTGGSIKFRSENTIILMTTEHETVHFLGFGHGCGWKSVQNQLCQNQTQADEITMTDVAYIELMYRTRALERKYDTRFSMGESDIGEEVVMLGLPQKILHSR